MASGSKRKSDDKAGSEGRHGMTDETVSEATANEFEEVFERARQTVKPIIRKEELNERVGEDILNFKMD